MMRLLIDQAVTSGLLVREHDCLLMTLQQLDEVFSPSFDALNSACFGGDNPTYRIVKHNTYFTKYNKRKADIEALMA